LVARGRVTTRIDCPREDAFDHVSDVENNPEWRTAVIQTRWLDPGPTRPGRRGEQVSRVLGRRYTVTAEVIDWDPPRHIGWATTAGGADVRTSCQIEADGDGCILTLESEGVSTGAWRLLTPIAAAMLRRQSGADVERLRRILEERRPGHSVDLSAARPGK